MPPTALEEPTDAEMAALAAFLLPLPAPAPDLAEISTVAAAPVEPLLARVRAAEHAAALAQDWALAVFLNTVDTQLSALMNALDGRIFDRPAGLPADIAVALDELRAHLA